MCYANINAFIQQKIIIFLVFDSLVDYRNSIFKNCKRLCCSNFHTQ